MPSETSAVGGLTLPIPAGVAGARLTDPVLDMVLDFAAWYIKNALDARLAMLLPAGDIVDACPTANRFRFDPTDPQGVKVLMPLPSLFVYWEGLSKGVPFTTMHTYRVRELQVLYCYEELPSQASKVERIGWANAVDAAWHKMSERQAHSSYTPSGGAVGMTPSQALAALGVVDWRYLGGEQGRFGIDEGPHAARRAKRTSGRDWPSVRGKFEVWERIEPMTMEDPTDVLGDGLVTFNVGCESDETVPLMERVLDAPDGSEEL